MDIQFLDLIKIGVPAVCVFLSFFSMIHLFFRREKNLRINKYKEKQGKILLQNKMQAYERLLLFLERMHIPVLLDRCMAAQPSSFEVLTQLMVNQINQEFEHNVVQQLYVSDDLWKMIKESKHISITLISKVKREQPLEATCTDYTRALLGFFLNKEMPFPTDPAIQALKAELRALFV